MAPDLTIVLLGKSGVGKSASANTILGQPKFQSRISFQPVTKVICKESAQVFGKHILVTDTPGILDTPDVEAELTVFCQDVLKSQAPCLFLVMVKVDRFSPEDLKAVEASMRVLGHKGMKKSYLLFTHGDSLKGMSLTDYIFEQEDGALPEVVRKFGGAFPLFNNKETENKDEQVRSLLVKTNYLRTEVPVRSAELEDRRIVLLGRPGQGKSSSGNTILGCKGFHSGCDFDSVTVESVSETAEVEGRQVTVFDSPGFSDRDLTPTQAYYEIMKTLIEASPGPHAFVIVVKIGRVSETDVRLYELLPQLFGSEALKYTMVLFTHGDELRGQSIKEKIQANRCMSTLLSKCGERYCVFDNTQTGNRQQVRSFLNQIDKMVSENGGEHCSSDMFRMAETFIREEDNRSRQARTSNMHINTAVNRAFMPRTTNRPDNTTYPRLRTTNRRDNTTYPPLSTTNRPDNTTYPPLSTTNRPDNTTYPPLSTTNRPDNTTYPPLSTTNRRDNTTYPPLSTTNRRDNTTNPPLSTTNRRDNTTYPPLSTTNRRDNTTYPPLSTTNRPDNTTYPLLPTPLSTTYTPVNSTYNLLSTTYTPVDSTYNPLSTTCTPVDNTYNPLSTTYTPVDSTYNPLSTSYTPVDSTYNPLSTTCTPVDSTYNPLSTTYTPVDSTYNPLSTSYTPVDSTYNPLSTTYTPVNSTYNLLSTTYTPVNSTYNPLSTTYTPVNSTYNPLSTTYTPVNSTYNPLSTTYTPVNSTYNPLSTTYTPVNSTYNPLSTTYTSVNSTYNPLSTTYTPVNSTYNPLSTTYTPVNSTYTPLSTTYTPVNSTYTPLSTTYTPVNITTTSGQG